MSASEIVLLDTSIIVAHFRREQALAEKLKSAMLYISLPVLGELYYGDFKSEHQAKTLKQVQEFCVSAPSCCLTRPLPALRLHQGGPGTRGLPNSRE